MLFCIDCRYFADYDSGANGCRHPDNLLPPDPVYGVVLTRFELRKMRADHGPCGAEGKLWQPKRETKSIIARLFGH